MALPLSSLSPCGKMCSFVLGLLLLTSVLSSPVCDFAHAPVEAGDSHVYRISVLIGGRQVGAPPPPSRSSC
jgi:hypothetical protein